MAHPPSTKCTNELLLARVWDWGNGKPPDLKRERERERLQKTKSARVEKTGRRTETPFTTPLALLNLSAYNFEASLTEFMLIHEVSLNF